MKEKILKKICVVWNYLMSVRLYIVFWQNRWDSSLISGQYIQSIILSNIVNYQRHLMVGVAAYFGISSSTIFFSTSHFWKCNNPVNLNVCLLVFWAVGLLVGLSVCQNFLKGLEVTRSTFSRYHVFEDDQFSNTHGPHFWGIILQC